MVYNGSDFDWPVSWQCAFAVQPCSGPVLVFLERFVFRFGFAPDTFEFDFGLASSKGQPVQQQFHRDV